MGYCEDKVGPEIKIVVLKGFMVLIGEFLREAEEYVTLRKPVTILNSITEGEMNYSYAPYLEFTEDYFDGMRFNYDDIMNVYTPIHQMALEYTETYLEA